MRNIWGLLVRCVVFSGITAGLVIGVATAVPQAAAQANTPRSIETFSNIKVTAEDHVLGRADAPVTIVEYASLTCGHCADFHNKELPDLKKAYISTGKVRLVYRDFPLDREALLDPLPFRPVFLLGMSFIPSKFVQILDFRLIPPRAGCTGNRIDDDYGDRNA